MIKAGLAAMLLCTVLAHPLGIAADRQAVQRPLPSANCAFGEWDDPSGLALPSEVSPLRWRFTPAVASVSEGEWMVAATTIARFDSAQVKFPNVVMFSTTGRSVALPAGDFIFAFPRLLEGPAGSYYMLWGEPPRDGRTFTNADWLSLPIESVWLAVLGSDGAWSEPRKLIETSTRLYWTWQFGRATLEHGTLHVVVSSYALRPTALYYVQWSPDALIQRIFEPTFAPSTDVAASDTLVTITFAGINEPRQDTRNRVYVMQSHDSGQSWTAAREVSPGAGHSTEDTAHDVFLSTDTHTVLWTASSGGSSMFDHLHFAQAPSGLAYQPTTVELPDRLVDLQVSGDSCGGMHVMALHANAAANGRREAAYFHIDSEGRESAIIPFAGFHIGTIAIHAAGNSVVVVFDGYRSPPGLDAERALFVARRARLF